MNDEELKMTANAVSTLAITLDTSVTEILGVLMSEYLIDREERAQIIDFIASV
jgi:hypothetical protein